MIPALYPELINNNRDLFYVITQEKSTHAGGSVSKCDKAAAQEEEITVISSGWSEGRIPGYPVGSVGSGQRLLPWPVGRLG